MLKLPALIFLISVFSLASGQVVLNDQRKVELVTNKIEALYDESGQMDWTEAHMRASEFKTGILKTYHYGTPGAYWLKIPISNQSRNRWILEHQDPNIDVMKVFYLDQQGKLIEKQELGGAMPFHSRDIQHINLSCDIPYQLDETGTILIRVESELYFHYLFQIVKQQDFINYSVNEYFSLGIFYGIIIIMVLYNLLIYFSVRNNLYIFYVFYVLLSGLYTCGHEVTFQFLWPGIPGINDTLWAVIHIPIAFCFYLYGRSFLYSSDKHIRIMLYALPLFAVQVLVEHFILDSNFYNHTLLIPFLLMLYYGIKRYQSGYSPAIYFVAGTSVIIIGMIIQTLMREGLIPSNIFTVYSLNLAIVVEIAIFSRALGERIRFVRAEQEKSANQVIKQLQINQKLKDEMNEKLEVQVADRTKELSAANDEIKKLNALLSADNEQLKLNMAELQKARLLHVEIDFDEFTKTYPDDESCFDFLSGLKWGDHYHCQKCGNDKHFEGRTEHAKRCSKCGFDETPQLYTLLSNVKFSIVKAFYIIYFYHNTNGKITSTEMSKILYMRQKTVWSFIQKIKLRIEERAEDGIEIEKWFDLLIDKEYKSQNKAS